MIKYSLLLSFCSLFQMFISYKLLKTFTMSSHRLDYVSYCINFCSALQVYFISQSYLGLIFVHSPQLYCNDIKRTFIVSVYPLYYHDHKCHWARYAYICLSVFWSKCRHCMVFLYFIYYDFLSYPCANYLCPIIFLNSFFILL